MAVIASHERLVIVESRGTIQYIKGVYPFTTADEFAIEFPGMGCDISGYCMVRQTIQHLLYLAPLTERHDRTGYTVVKLHNRNNADSDGKW